VCGGPVVLNLPMETFVVRVVVYMALKQFLVFWVIYNVYFSVRLVFGSCHDWSKVMEFICEIRNKSKLNLSNVCCHSGQNLQFYLLSKNEKIKIWKTVILPVLCQGKSYLCTDLDRPWGLQEDEAPTVSSQLAHEGGKVALSTGRIYPQETSLVLVSVGDMVRLEGLC
jgi:hypothetical protein